MTGASSRFISRRVFLRGVAAGAGCLIVSSAVPSRLLAEEILLNQSNLERILANPQKDSFRFIFCGDSHIPFDDAGVFEKIIRGANGLKPDFALIGGDAVQVGNPACFAAYMSKYRKFKVPVITVLGNHDTAFSDYSDSGEWRKRFGATFYSFDYGKCRFVIIDNANFRLLPEEWGFLEERLDTDRVKFVAMHRPVNYVNALYATPLQDDEFRSVIEKRGGDYVLAGHEHHYGRYEAGGVVYVVSGGAGGRLNTETENNFHHYIVFTVEGGEVSEEVVKI